MSVTVIETWSSMCGRSVSTHTTQWAIYAPIGSKSTTQGGYVARRSRVLRLAVAEGPVFLLHFNKIDEDVFGPQAWAFDEVGGDAREEPLFLFDGSSVADGELDDREAVGTSKVSTSARWTP